MWGQCMFCKRPYDATPGEEFGVVYLDQHGASTTRQGGMSGSRAYCDGEPRHMLPLDRPSIMVIFGVPGSGKDSLLGTVDKQGRLAGEQGVSLSLTTDHAARLDGPRAATQPASTDFPYLPYELTATDSRTAVDLPRKLWVYNVAGEDVGQSDIRLEDTFPFLPFAETLVLAVPPEALTGLPRVPGSGNAQIHMRTTRGTQQFTEALKRLNAPPSAQWQGTVIIALTKCDRYRDQEDFPQDLLQERDYGDADRTWVDLMADEQQRLARFLRDHGGGDILHAARMPNQPVFLVAISDTGNDDPTAAPSGDGDPTRSLDIVYLTLLREGIAHVE